MHQNCELEYDELLFQLQFGRAVIHSSFSHSQASVGVVAQPAFENLYLDKLEPCDILVPTEGLEASKSQGPVLRGIKLQK